MSPTVSIIVPIYNAKDYIKRCVDSILNQEYKDFELLLVNDGSTDESGKICEEYARKDNRVFVLHKDNTGVSDTRNLAISKARGEYLQFIDSDDWITPDATKLLVRTAQDYHCDLVIADFYRVVGERVSRKGDIEENGVLTKEEFAEYMMENPADFYYGVLWNKLYRRNIVEKYQLRMDARISWCEDFMFNLEYILHAEVFYALQAPIYYYVKRKGSLVSQGFSISQSIKMKLMVFEYYNNFYKYVYDEKDYEKKRLQVYRFLIDAANDNLVQPSLLPGVKKLGDERLQINTNMIDGDGIFMGFYRQRKLLERYLEVVTLKYDVSLKEGMLLFFLKNAPVLESKKELADFIGISVRSVSLILQKLVKKELLKVTDIRAKRTQSKTFQIEILPAAEPILEELAIVEQDFERTRFAGFNDNERRQYDNLNRKIKDNILEVLR